MADQFRLDPTSLRGIAHPLRVRILTELRENGPATATTLAQRLGQSSGATSYHLRQLATYGFITDDPDAAPGGRERWWKAAHHGTTLEESVALDSPETAEAYLRAIAALYQERMDRWLNEATSLPDRWSRAATLSDWRLRLTPEQGRRLHDAIIELAGEYPPDDDPDAEGERVHLQVQLMPFVSRP